MNLLHIFNKIVGQPICHMNLLHISINVVGQQISYESATHFQQAPSQSQNYLLAKIWALMNKLGKVQQQPIMKTK